MAVPSLLTINLSISVDVHIMHRPIVYLFNGQTVL